MFCHQKHRLFYLFPLLLSFALGCAKMPDPWLEVPGKFKVLVSFPPLYSMVKSVAGDRAAVISLCTTTGPHDYAFNAKDTILLRKADLFFYNGLELDNLFVERLAKDSSNPKLKFSSLGKKVPKNLRIESKEEKPGHEGHNHGSFDPHIWLGVRQSLLMINAIRDELSLLDPEAAEEYKNRAASLAATLEEIQKEGITLLEGKKNKVIVTFHESLGYFASSFGIEIAGVIQKAPGDSPNALELAKIVQMCVEKKPSLIAVEPQYPKTTSAKLLQEELKKKGIEIPLVEIDPLETCTQADLAPKWYEIKYKQNLEALAKNLQ
jgi:ABC-type Zn uptake system ZnuABC Zn-binding protein ZnuA